MKKYWRLNLIALCMMFICTSCVIPLPNRTVRNIISERVTVKGTPIELIEQEIVFQRRFYPFTPEGPFVTSQSACKFSYIMVNANGNRKELKFLTKKDVETDYFVGFPISDGRWIAITIPEKNRHDWPIPEDLTVFVFKTNSILFSLTIPSSLRSDVHAPEEPWPGGPTWKPLTGVDYTASRFRFNAGNEQVTFRTSGGDLLFNPNDGTLRKTAGDQSLEHPHQEK